MTDRTPPPHSAPQVMARIWQPQVRPSPATLHLRTVSPTHCSLRAPAYAYLRATQPPLCPVSCPELSNHATFQTRLIFQVALNGTAGTFHFLLAVPFCPVSSEQLCSELLLAILLTDLSGHSDELLRLAFGQSQAPEV